MGDDFDPVEVAARMLGRPRPRRRDIAREVLDRPDPEPVQPTPKPEPLTPADREDVAELARIALGRQRLPASASGNTALDADKRDRLRRMAHDQATGRLLPPGL